MPPPLFLLPTELRLKIYRHFLRSRIQPYPSSRPHHTPLLLTSRLVHDEVAPLIPSNTHYSFRTTADLVTYLSALPRDTIPLLRQVTVTGHPFPIYPPDDLSSYCTFSFPSMPLLFPGLQLDRLTVWDAYHGPGVDEDGWGHDATWGEVGDFVKGGKGWRELVFRSRDDRWIKGVTFLTSGPAGTEEKTSGREEQPAHWQRLLLERDGSSSGADVEMYTFDATDDEAERGRKKVEGVYMPREEEEEEEEVTEEELTFPEGTDFQVKVDAQKARSERIKARKAVGIEVVVRRGRGVDVVQDGKTDQDYEKRLLDIFEKLSWREIQEQELFVQGGDTDPCGHL